MGKLYVPLAVDCTVVVPPMVGPSSVTALFAAFRLSSSTAPSYRLFLLFSSK